ncbi:hypothetical protein NAD41_002344 [Salmonella enterica]|nr:hypothetical protein [Salmonella enterica]EKK6596312.1 hypothetical protein [Salmonella enterica]
MDNAPITTGERLEWMAEQCDRFHFQVTKEGYQILAAKGEECYEADGPLHNMHNAVDNAFYEILQTR